MIKIVFGKPKLYGGGTGHSRLYVEKDGKYYDLDLVFSQPGLPASSLEIKECGVVVKESYADLRPLQKCNIIDSMHDKITRPPRDDIGEYKG